LTLLSTHHSLASRASHKSTILRPLLPTQPPLSTTTSFPGLSRPAETLRIPASPKIESRQQFLPLTTHGMQGPTRSEDCLLLQLYKRCRFRSKKDLDLSAPVYIYNISHTDRIICWALSLIIDVGFSHRDTLICPHWLILETKNVLGSRKLAAVSDAEVD
jgi:hypothetical protein